MRFKTHATYWCGPTCWPAQGQQYRHPGHQGPGRAAVLQALPARARLETRLGMGHEDRRAPWRSSSGSAWSSSCATPPAWPPATSPLDAPERGGHQHRPRPPWSSEAAGPRREAAAAQRDDAVHQVLTSRGGQPRRPGSGRAGDPPADGGRGGGRHPGRAGASRLPGRLLERAAVLEPPPVSWRVSLCRAWQALTATSRCGCRPPAELLAALADGTCASARTPASALRAGPTSGWPLDRCFKGRRSPAAVAGSARAQPTAPAAAASPPGGVLEEQHHPAAEGGGCWWPGSWPPARGSPRWRAGPPGRPHRQLLHLGRGGPAGRAPWCPPRRGRPETTMLAASVRAARTEVESSPDTPGRESSRRPTRSASGPQHPPHLAGEVALDGAKVAPAP